jgi:hypothetical protein
MKKDSLLERIGSTVDGKALYKGVYRFYETEGLPLDILFDLLDQKNSMVSWLHFYEEAILNGMKHDRIISKLEESICDVWGKAFFDIVKSNLDIYSKFRVTWKGTTEELIEYLFNKNIQNEIKPDRIIIINDPLPYSHNVQFIDSKKLRTVPKTEPMNSIEFDKTILA